jgi:hypothetical protein
MSANVERSSTFAACSTVAGSLFVSAEAVSSADSFFDPHPRKQATAHATMTFAITVREHSLGLGSTHASSATGQIRRGERVEVGALAETNFRNIESLSEYIPRMLLKWRAPCERLFLF